MEKNHRLVEEVKELAENALRNLKEKEKIIRQFLGQLSIGWLKMVIKVAQENLKKKEKELEPEPPNGK